MKPKSKHMQVHTHITFNEWSNDNPHEEDNDFAIIIENIRFWKTWSAWNAAILSLLDGS